MIATFITVDCSNISTFYLEISAEIKCVYYNVWTLCYVSKPLPFFIAKASTKNAYFLTVMTATTTTLSFYLIIHYPVVFTA